MFQLFSQLQQVGALQIKYARFLFFREQGHITLHLVDWVGQEAMHRYCVKASGGFRNKTNCVKSRLYWACQLQQIDTMTPESRSQQVRSFTTHDESLLIMGWEVWELFAISVSWQMRNITQLLCVSPEIQKKTCHGSFCIKCGHWRKGHASTQECAALTACDAHSSVVITFNIRCAWLKWLVVYKVKR